MRTYLPIGAEVWTVIESLADRWFSGEPFHYEVVRGKVVGIFRGGYTEYQVSTTNRKGHNSILLYLRTGMYGKTYFGTEPGDCGYKGEIKMISYTELKEKGRIDLDAYR